MPEPIAPTNQPAAPTQPAAPSAPETYDSNGRTQVEDNLFVPENEEATPNTPTNSKGTQTTQTTPANEDNGEVTTTETGKAAVTQPDNNNLLAGKYKTEEELNGGLEGLGLDPGSYKDAASKEAAYKAGQSAMTRITQQQADNEKRAREEATAAANNNNPATTPQDLAAKIIGSLDMTKITNVQELVEQLVPALTANMPQPGAQKTPDEIAAEIQPAIALREERIKTLAALETQVPRLGMKVDDTTGQQVPIDPTFRKAFAIHLMGNNYKRDAAGLKQAMTDFLSLGKSIAEAQGITTQQNANDKGSALQPGESGQSPAGGEKKTSAEEDILSGIMTAFTDHNHKVGND